MSMASVGAEPHLAPIVVIMLVMMTAGRPLKVIVGCGC
jgi:hypothetical protein